jgi:putative transcriptional regulator
MNKFSRDLVNSMREAYEHAHGNHAEGKRRGCGVTILLKRKSAGGRDLRRQTEAKPRVHVVAVPNVRAIRQKLRMSQTEFAEKYRIPLPTLKNWEQGRRQPDAPASAYLQVIARRPREISEALSDSNHAADSLF